MDNKVCIAHGGDISLPSGGTDRIAAFATGLVSKGVDVTLVVPQPSAELSDRFDGVNIKEIPLQRRGVVDQPLRAVYISRQAAQFAREAGAQLQIAHSPLAGVATLMGASDYILDMHDLVFPQKSYSNLPAGGSVQKIISIVEKRGVERAKHIITVSESLKKVIHHYWDIPLSKISIIPNGFRSEFSHMYSRDNAVSGRVVFLGEIHDKVHLDALIEIAEKDLTEELIIIGEGDYYDYLVEKAKDVVDGTIVFTGWLPPADAFRLVASATVAVAPYHQSLQYTTSSPVKLYAYAGIGVPTVVSEGPDIAARLGDKEAALVVENNAQFADHVESVHRSRELQRCLSENAASLSNELTWSKRGTELVSVYDRLQPARYSTNGVY